MKNLLIIIALFASFSVSAQTVQIAYKVKCTSKNYAGDSVSSAMEACKTYGNYNEYNCARAVSCTPYQSFCTAKNFAGDNIQDAVMRCITLGKNSKKLCLRGVSCR